MNNGYTSKGMTKLDILEQQRLAAIKKVDEDHYNPSSPNYMDNERYRWAIGAINSKVKDVINYLKCSRK